MYEITVFYILKHPLVSYAYTSIYAKMTHKVIYEMYYRIYEPS